MDLVKRVRSKKDPNHAGAQRQRDSTELAEVRSGWDLLHSDTAWKRESRFDSLRRRCCIGAIRFCNFDGFFRHFRFVCVGEV